MLNQIENKLQLIELVVPGVVGGNTNTIFAFPDQPFFRDKFVISIRSFCITDLSLSPSNNPLVSAAQLQTSYLNVYGNDPEYNTGNPTYGFWLQNIPLVSLRASNATAQATAPSVVNPVQFKPRIIAWEKSNITLPVALNNTTPLSFLLLVGYQNTPEALI